MSSSTTRKRPAGSPGAKILVTAGALAATVTGWAALTWKQAGAVANAAPLMTGVEAQLAMAGVSLEPLPTLVPAASTPIGAEIVVPPVRSVQLVLRSVSAPPPPPVVMTQSSRP
jgi:hypothetical protein